MKNSCLISLQHDLYDDRIYWKEALSLKKNGYKVTIISVDIIYQKGMTKEGIYYIKIPQRKTINIFINKLLQIFPQYNIYHAILNEAKRVEANIYHMHDLGLIKIGKKLKKLPGKPKVIYDVHEPFPENILDYYTGKNPLVILFKKLYATYIFHMELHYAKDVDFIITTEENVNHKFTKKCGKDKVAIIYNYTDMKPDLPGLSYKDKIYDVIYCGGISKFRGAIQMLEVARITTDAMPDVKFLLIGRIRESGLLEEMNQYINKNNLAKNVIIKEVVPYQEVKNYYNKSKIGIALFLPIRTHAIILPIKTFEYMAFGLPVVCSNFGHLAEYIKKNKAGELVNPGNIEEVANTVMKILNNREIYLQYSANGIQAVQQKYNWQIMENKLLNIYQKLL